MQTNCMGVYETITIRPVSSLGTKNKMAENGVRSEDVLGQKWDRCVSDTAIKFGII